MTKKRMAKQTCERDFKVMPTLAYFCPAFFRIKKKLLEDFFLRNGFWWELGGKLKIRLRVNKRRLFF